MPRRRTTWPLLRPRQHTAVVIEDGRLTLRVVDLQEGPPLVLLVVVQVTAKQNTLFGDGVGLRATRLQASVALQATGAITHFFPGRTLKNTDL